jgi:hypothetical protein
MKETAVTELHAVPITTSDADQPLFPPDAMAIMSISGFLKI